MPTSKPRKRQPPEELVELVPGVSIPRHFSSTVLTETPSWTVEIATDPETKQPRWITRSEHASGGGELVADTEGPWRRRMEDAIAAQVRKTTASRFTTERGWAISTDFEEHFPDVAVPTDAPRIDQAVVDAAEDAARRAVRPKPGRPPVTDDEKLRVLELYRTKSVAEIMEITDKKERTIRRWIADAKRLEAERGER